MTNDSAFGLCLVFDQSYYIDSIQDVQIAPDRFSKSDSILTPKEITECRASLGALQWGSSADPAFGPCKMQLAFD